MSEPRRRRPLPALVCLIALTLLTALVWWRVLNRDSGTATAKNKSCTRTQQTVLPNPVRVSVTVLNSTNRAGLAKTTSTRLTALGFKVNSYGNDTGHAAIAGIAEIRYSSDQALSAKLLGYYFPTATQVALTDGSTGKVIVSLGTKFTALPAAASVQAAMTTDGVTVAARTAPAPTPTAAGSTCKP